MTIVIRAFRCGCPKRHTWVEVSTLTSIRSIKRERCGCGTSTVSFAIPLSFQEADTLASWISAVLDSIEEEERRG